MIRTIFFGAVLLAMSCPAPTSAHDALPVALALDQSGPTGYQLRVRSPPSLAQRAPRLDVAPPCRTVTRQPQSLLIRCPAGEPPTALTLTYSGPTGNAPIVLRLSYAGGEPRTLAAPAGTTRIDLPTRQSPANVLPGYFTAGLQHIGGGLDHLLFLVCLMLIAESARRIVLTVTGFTVGHAITLTLASLDWVRVDGGAVEVLIALSIVFAAAEIIRGRTTTLTWRRPALVAILFGLLHGLGFAGALRDIGLPRDQLPLSLAAFNLGIEAGQLVFVVAVMILGRMVEKLFWQFRPDKRLRSSTYRILAWPIGLLASVWLFERASLLVTVS